MEYERFLKITLGLKAQQEKLNKLYKLGVSLTELVDPYYGFIDELIREVYGEEGYNWWSWFCYENEYGEKDWSKADRYQSHEDGSVTLINKDEMKTPQYGAHDKEGNPICYSLESTWEYLEKNHKQQS
jgi:hypothetical protein